MTLTLDFQGQILKKLYPWSGVANWHGLIGMWVDKKSDIPTFVTFNFDLTCDLDLRFSRSNLKKKAVSQEWDGQ